MPCLGFGGDAVPMPDSGSSLAVVESPELVDLASVSESGEFLGREEEQSDNHVRLEHRDTAGEV